MSAISDILGLGLQRLETDSGGDVTAGKVTYPASGGTAYACTVSTLNKGNTLEAGGKLFTIQFSVHIRTAVLGAVVPQTGKKISYSSVTYRIGNVRLMQGYYALDLIDVDH